MLVAIKKSLEGTSGFSPETVVPKFPKNPNATIPYSFHDYVTAIQAKRICYKVEGIEGIPDDFRITGMDFFAQEAEDDSEKYTWLQVPFVKCDPEGCQDIGEDAASKFCEYQILAVAPQDATMTTGVDRAASFRDFVYDKYPVLNDPERLPFNYDFVKIFGSESEIESYIKSKDYGTTGNPKIALAVVFPKGQGEKDYAYKIRANTTNINAPARNFDRPGMTTTPQTDRLFNDYAKLDESCPTEGGAAYLGPKQTSCTRQYVYNGVLTIQRLVGDWVMNITGAESAGYAVAEHGVQFVSFPTLQYTYDGFYESIAREFG